MNTRASNYLSAAKTSIGKAVSAKHELARKPAIYIACLGFPGLTERNGRRDSQSAVLFVKESDQSVARRDGVMFVYRREIFGFGRVRDIDSCGDREWLPNYTGYGVEIDVSPITYAPFVSDELCHDFDGLMTEMDNIMSSGRWPWKCDFTPQGFLAPDRAKALALITDAYTNAT